MPRIQLAKMDVERNFEEFIKPKYNMNFVLKEEQIRIIHYVLQRQHTMGVLPTGFGKSMCFILPPLLLNIHIDGHVSLVISPLISLMKSQCEYLLNMGVSCAVVTRWKNMTDDVKYGNCNIEILFFFHNTVLPNYVRVLK